MTKYVRIAGNPTIGIVVLGEDGTISSLNTADPAATWVTSTTAPKDADDNFVSLSTTGTNGGATTVATSRSVSYLNTLGNLDAKWKSAKPALPSSINILGVAGDPFGGYMLLSGDGKFYPTPAEGKDWAAASGTLSFKGTANFVLGDSKGQVIVSNASELARNGGDCGNWTPIKPESPVEIQLITGDVTKGFIVYGEGQLYALDVSKGAVWKPLPTPKFQFLALSGNPGDGVAAVIGDSTGGGNIVVYSATPAKGQWSLALAPQAPAQPA
jgi:hypothetical protein